MEFLDFKIWLTLISLCSSINSENYTRGANVLENDTTIKQIENSFACMEGCNCERKHILCAEMVLPQSIMLSTMDCSGANFKNFPATLPDKIEAAIFTGQIIRENSFSSGMPSGADILYLDLSNCSIVNMEHIRGIYVYTKMTFLSLRNNKLTLINGSIANDNLQTLDLSNNNISVVADEAFKKTTKLKVVNLSQNYLTVISSSLFRSLHELSALDLSYNNINSIDEKAFVSLAKLNHLNLSNNKLKSLSADIFINFENLLILDISYNVLHSVPSKQLQSMTRLKKLGINGNMIAKLNAGDFSNMSIASLEISFMPRLVIVEAFAFVNMSALLSVEMHDNTNLFLIHQNAFQQVPVLKSLYVHNNKLTQLSVNIIDNVPSLQEIHMYHNPMRCDCNVLWIREDIQSNRTKFYHPEAIKCAYPLNVSGKSLKEVKEADIARVCAPTTLPSFGESYDLKLGEDLRLQCHAYGVPEPTIRWILPDVKAVQDRAEILNSNTSLGVRSMTEADSGTYSCEARNSVGYDLSSTRITVHSETNSYEARNSVGYYLSSTHVTVHSETNSYEARNSVGYDLSSTRVTVRNASIDLVIVAASWDTVTVQWNGTGQDSNFSYFQLQYKEAVVGDLEINMPDKWYKIIKLGTQYNNYTATNLNENTRYEICILYVYEQQLHKGDCKVFSTSLKLHFLHVDDWREKLLAGGFMVFGLLMTVVCLVTLIKRVRTQNGFKGKESRLCIPLRRVCKTISVPNDSPTKSLLSFQTNIDDVEQY
ncbi:leucine-rich repeat neuronal protein 3-like [Dreissena polymorpha]|uniref:leucine-rich repeat neuronal protein 3-like n=1 Tax=Dreissena polymorpha TaxID=45954 RepID=UPI0022644316|nr:leucine-rich repeat neuronal protein 3-like [Dreissena polymorpha]